jgi:hypothetical protein
MAKKKETNNRKSLFAAIADKTGGALFSDGGNVKYTIDTGSLALNYICSGKFIGGGIANFTDVLSTFNGIIKAIHKNNNVFSRIKKLPNCENICSKPGGNPPVWK